ncbi:DUF4476 domain-containing protein [Hymenobacter persicinus]|uniref:DUF4476 domain-containing protein n=1 Tax=Hymenobacter persicinus TaxID=2025506 RepID=A0A4V1ZAL7_9BACT|nr:DUF4476 domain-containing protein [Hymenobacter persicinus]RYU78694.1 DUF4476 domain-containing protein [Hymenobacter persicinus]
MKKALLLCLGLLLLASGLRAAPANVNFASERGMSFQLIFDGRPLTRGAARQVHIDRLTPGYHWAEFVIPTGYGRPYNFRTRVFLDPGLETSFVLITRSGYAPVLRKVAEVALYPGYGPGRGGNGYGHGNHGGYQNAPGGYDSDYGYPNDGGNYGNPNDGYGGQYDGGNNLRVMSPQDADMLVQTVKRNSFDSNRLSIAKQALDQTYIQSDDLRRLLDTFDFEASKVELAKYAYARVADRQNFYRIYDTFDFQTSVQEVQRAVGGGRN